MKPRAGWHPWAMLGPSLAILVVFFVFPVALAAYESVFEWDMLTPPAYVGLDNYRDLAARGELLRIALRTLAFSVTVGACLFAAS